MTDPTLVITEAGIRQALRRLRVERTLTQQDVAELLGQPQSFVSKLESGERSLHLAEIEAISEALGVSRGRLINEAEGVQSILDRWDMTEAELTELVDENPSLRGIMLGYAAEVKFRHIYLDHREDISSEKDDDHDRTKKGDRRLRYKGHDIVVEVKSLQTATVEHDEVTGRWTGKSQVDGSDRRIIKFNDGTELNTTLLLRGEFDILAVNCFAFGGEWRYVFALNKDLETSNWAKYTEEQRNQLIKSMQSVSWPPTTPFTDDFDEILERALQAKQAAPNVEEISE